MSSVDDLIDMVVDIGLSKVANLYADVEILMTVTDLMYGQTGIILLVFYGAFIWSYIVNFFAPFVKLCNKEYFNKCKRENTIFCENPNGQSAWWAQLFGIRAALVIHTLVFDIGLTIFASEDSYLDPYVLYLKVTASVTNFMMKVRYFYSDDEE